MMSRFPQKNGSSVVEGSSTLRTRQSSELTAAPIACGTVNPRARSMDPVSQVGMQNAGQANNAQKSMIPLMNGVDPLTVRGYIAG